MHIGILDLLPRVRVDELGLSVHLRPVGVQKGHRLLGEGLRGHGVEELESLRVQLLSEGLRASGASLLVELRSVGSHCVVEGSVERNEVFVLNCPPADRRPSFDLCISDFSFLKAASKSLDKMNRVSF